ncbi:hypothetical protein [Leminorella grimontii]|uniref:hypothetical protein n=1 Tax=Leminorella grimontii TaxID=82981 RepID=UPI002085F20E|nr:hypothetical protein [Leminorella grimontii]GKX58669.1 hypothetical protein SOASR031_09840 [Leminorella grimontii]
MLNELINRLPDGRAENELVRFMRALSEGEKASIVEMILAHDFSSVRGSVLRIIPRVIRDRDVLIKFLDAGLEKKHPYGARFWIKATVPGLGYKKLLNHLQEIAEKEPEWIVHAWYYLVLLVRKEAPERMYILEKIRNTVDITLNSELRDFWQRNKDSVPI